MSSEPLIRRSFVERRLSHAELASDGGTGVGERSPRVDVRLKLIDLSLVPRWGLKGRGVSAWLSRNGASLPSADNRAERQADGSLLARLSPAEVLVLAALDRQASLAEAMERIPPEGEDACYPVPRRDSHCWFVAVGEDAHKMFAKLCAVDLAPDRFADGQIAQTSVARLSAIVVRNDLKDALSFFLLADSASAEYLWDCLLDAMTEFGGAVSYSPVTASA
jgi:sarcosine oxidase subunit gamma